MTISRYLVLFLISISLFVFQSNGQGIRGRVLNNIKEPISGACVFLTNNDHHTHSNALGDFDLEEAKIGDTLVVTHVGFETFKIVISTLGDPITLKLKEQVIELSNVTISPSLDAINLFSKIDLGVAPVANSQEILQRVSGLVLGQHAGGGKAEQIFLRGFDIDHGTDIDITVDGLPVNMVSHAHGQGYADLHFLIPETIAKIDFGKGPYYANHGNFTTAGYAAFRTKKRLKNSSVKVQYGRFNSKRIVGLFNLKSSDDESSYIATELSTSDGPFESSQNFYRLNLMGKYSKKLQNNATISILFSHFDSQWDASGQIPQRLVDAGIISRFGAVDDTEGGFTSRSNMKLNFDKKISSQSYINNTIYFSKYDFELFSNFTFFLYDALNGDQIRQRENRKIFGYNSVWGNFFQLGNFSGQIKAGIGARHDVIMDVELSNTINRSEIQDYLALGDITETNISGYLVGEIEVGEMLISPSVRVDLFDFTYEDETIPQYNPQSLSKPFISPKLNLLFNQSEDLQFYLKTGIGFHSNDTRVVVARNGEEIIPSAYGADLGMILKPTPKILLNAALWTLRLDQEFVYVGDAGIVEPSGKTKRQGLDLGLRYQISNNLFLFSDVNYTSAKATDQPEGEDQIPLAPSFTATGGINLVNYNGFNGGARLRLITDRPANEDNSIVARGYSIIDTNINYTIGRFNLSVAVRNVLNQEWNETQFATESRLQTETDSVEEIHFTPGSPRAFETSLTYRF